VPQALAHIDQAIHHTGPLSALLDTKGMVLVHAGRSDDALWFLELAASDPDADPRHAFHLALALHRAGDTTRAGSEMQRLLGEDLSSEILTPTESQLLAMLRRTYTQSE
jgi:Flp pilus assembly protein TadD